MAGQTVIIGYGTKGRSVIRTLGQSGLPDESIVVLDVSAEAEENRLLLRQSGADHVVISSDDAGRMLAISTIRPAAGIVIADLLDRGRGLDLIERAGPQASHLSGGEAWLSRSMAS